MPKIRMRKASISIAILLCAVPIAAHAQSVVDEDTAVELALAREGVSARDDAERAASAAEIDVIGPRENPTVQVSREGAGGESEYQLGIVQPLDLNGRRGSLRDAARADVLATEADIARRRQVLVADVRQAYVRCAAARAQLDVWERYTVYLAEAERVSTARAEAGDTAVYDVRRVRVERRSADAQLARARGDAAANCAALASLTGIADPRVEHAVITRLTSAAQPGERVDLLADQRRIEAAKSRVRAADQARLPQLEVGVGVLRRDDGIETAYGPAVSVGFTVPLWTSGSAAVLREKARVAALESELLIARRQVEAERSAASARLAAAREAAVIAAGARDDAGRLGTIAETAYQAGEIGVVELLDAYEAAREADLSVIALATDAALAAVEYDLAIGRTY